MRVFLLQGRDAGCLQFTLLSIIVFTRVTEVTRFPCGARLKVDVDISLADEDRQRTGRYPALGCIESCERNINELIQKPTNK